MTLAALFLALIATPADVSPRSTAPGEPVLLSFESDRCGFCKQMRPGLSQLAQAGYPVKSINVDEDREASRQYKITGLPTFIVVDAEGRALARTEGFQPVGELAKLYRTAQAKARSREGDGPAAIQVSDRRDADADEDEADDDRLGSKKAPNPQPWETVVRIRMTLSSHSEGVGSGTIIYSDAKQAIILTCAHIFKEDGKQTPIPSRYTIPIAVDLFDGQLGGPKKNQVHQTETLRGEAIDYDLINDVGLIRIRPGRVLPYSKVVPSYWTPKEGMHMITVGCSEGREATAWDTNILRPNAGLRHGKSGDVFHMIECEHAPKQGRSGGGLYTDNGYVAGVCDFADPSSDHGLYAVPQSIYRLLDRNRLTVLYDPATSRPDEAQGRLVKATPTPKPKRSDGTLRAQSPSEPDMPPPGAFGIKPPVVASENPAGSTPGRMPWHAPASAPAKLAGRKVAPAEEAEQGNEAIAAGMKRRGNDELPAPAAAASETAEADDLPPPVKSGVGSKWKPVRRSDAGL